PVRPIGWTCAFSRLLYPACHGPEALPGPRRDRREGPGLVPGGDPQAVLRRADPRRAPRELRTAEPLADDARVRGGPGDDRASADGDRALWQLERGEAHRRARPAAVRAARGARRPPARPRRRARPHPDREGPRRAARLDAVEIALL